jgi:Holliday junction resolvasome RuvABC endonuclease subunit
VICIGHDPGTRNPGLAVVQRVARGWKIIHLPVITSVEQLLEELTEIGQSVDVRCVSSEAVAWSLHRKSQGYGSGGILRSVGAVELFARQLRIPFVTVAPNTWRKRITGNGRASKQQVRACLSRTVKNWPLRMPSLNRSDAVAIAIAGAMSPGARAGNEASNVRH